jgi:DNA-binding transcriptional LysR family regulator
MELRHIRYFLAVADALNFTKAAEKLRITQPSLTRQIQDLENELGARLFDRTKKQVKLTTQGNVLLPGARQLLNLASEITDAVRSLNQAPPTGSISIGFIANLPPPLLHTSLACFEKDYPDISINLFGIASLESLRSLDGGAIDIAFMGILQPPDDLELNSMIIESRRAIGLLPIDYPRLHRRHIRISDIKSTPLIAMSDQYCPGYLDWLHKTWKAVGFEPKIAQVVNSRDELIGAVASRSGVAIASEDIGKPDFGDIVVRRVEPEVYFQSSVVWRKENVSAALGAFLATLERAAANGS